MATATEIATKIPVEVYLHCSDYEPDAEYVDGTIEERPMGEWDHTTWQQALHLWFFQHKQEWGIRVRQEQRVQVSPTRYRVPDVTVVHTPSVVEQIVTQTPIAVFEVLSPQDRMSRVSVKLEDYVCMGIQTVIVVDPTKKLISRYLNGKLETVTDEVWKLPGSACWIDWRQVEQLLD